MVRPSFRHVLPALVACMVGIGAAPGCSGGPNRTRDVAGDRRSRSPGTASSTTGLDVPAPPPADTPSAKVEHPRVVAKASARALTVDQDRVYYGDSEDDGVYSIAKAGGEPIRIARHAPVAGALALEASAITWIASPGDAVLRALVTGSAQPTTLRDRGIFSDVTAIGDDVFITEAVGPGGVLLRITGQTTSRLAAFDGSPRAVMADKTHAYVVTPTKVLRSPRDRGELETVGTGTRFTHADIDETSIYVVA